MPITPEFTITQDNKFLYFIIYCPGSRIKEMELIIDDCDFSFSADPYLLILHFQHSLKEDFESIADFDIDKGIFNAKIKKFNEGENFPEISLLSTLKNNFNNNNLKIEILERSTPLEFIDEPLDINKYGFGFQFINYFKNLNEILPFIIDLSDPENISLPFRKNLKIEDENNNFDPDSILNDYLNPYEINFNNLLPLFQPLTSEESKELLNIKKFEFLLSKDTAKITFFNLIDIVFSTLVDIVCFGIDGTCESVNNISKLSSSLSWFDCFDNLKDLQISLTRRLLLFSIYKNFNFSLNIWNEIKKILINRTNLLKILLITKKIFDKSDYKWRLNKIYIEPLIYWIQQLNENIYEEFSQLIINNNTFINKNDISEEWCLELLEKYGEKLLKNNQNFESVCENDLEFVQKFANDKDDEELEIHNYNEVNIYE